MKDDEPLVEDVKEDEEHDDDADDSDDDDDESPGFQFCLFQHCLILFYNILLF